MILGIVSGLLTAAFYFGLTSTDAVWLLSISTGYVGLALLAASLVIGPYNVLRRLPNPVSMDFRRDVGIWAGVYALAHVGVGLFVHLRGKPWLYFVWEEPQRYRIPLRYDVFGFANWTGLAGGLVIAVLLAVSNDWSLRRFGTQTWKSIQRWNYVAAGTVLAHGVAYQIIEHRQPRLIVLFAVLFAVTLASQAAGFLSRRADRNNRA